MHLFIYSKFRVSVQMLFSPQFTSGFLVLFIELICFICLFQLLFEQEIAEQILNNSIKEAAIEKGVKAVEDTWATMNFKVHKHFKGSEERGYTLGAVDDIVQALEDNSMNLQSMGASQYVALLLLL